MGAGQVGQLLEQFLLPLVITFCRQLLLHKVVFPWDVTVTVNRRLLGRACVRVYVISSSHGCTILLIRTNGLEFLFPSAHY